jgi:hypothetical protein
MITNAATNLLVLYTIKGIQIVDYSTTIRAKVL